MHQQQYIIVVCSVTCGTSPVKDSLTPNSSHPINSKSTVVFPGQRRNPVPSTWGHYLKVLSQPLVADSNIALVQTLRDVATLIEVWLTGRLSSHLLPSGPLLHCSYVTLLIMNSWQGSTFDAVVSLCFCLQVQVSSAKTCGWTSLNTKVWHLVRITIMLLNEERVENAVGFDSDLHGTDNTGTRNAITSFITCKWTVASCKKFFCYYL